MQCFSQNYHRAPESWVNSTVAKSSEIALQGGLRGYGKCRLCQKSAWAEPIASRRRYSWSLRWVFVPIISDAPPSRDMLQKGCAEW